MPSAIGRTSYFLPKQENRYQRARNKHYLDAQKLLRTTQQQGLTPAPLIYSPPSRPLNKESMTWRETSAYVNAQALYKTTQKLPESALEPLAKNIYPWQQLLMLSTIASSIAIPPKHPSEKLHQQDQPRNATNHNEAKKAYQQHRVDRRKYLDQDDHYLSKPSAERAVALKIMSPLSAQHATPLYQNPRNDARHHHPTSEHRRQILPSSYFSTIDDATHALRDTPSFVKTYPALLLDAKLAPFVVSSMLIQWMTKHHPRGTHSALSLLLSVGLAEGMAHARDAVRDSQMRNNETPPSPVSLSASPTEQSIKIHPCYDHKIIFRNELLQNALDTHFPVISPGTLDSLVQDDNQISSNNFISWYKLKSGFSENLIDENSATLEVMLKAIYLEQTYPIQQGNQAAQIAYAFDMAGQLITNKIGQDTSEGYSEQECLLSEVAHALQEGLDRDPVIHWYDYQKWPDIVKIAAISHQGGNMDCRILDTLQRKYQHVAKEESNHISDERSLEDNHVVRDISLFFQKRLAVTFENARKLINTSMQPAAQRADFKSILLPNLSFALLAGQERSHHQRGLFFKLIFILIIKEISQQHSLYFPTRFITSLVLLFVYI